MKLLYITNGIDGSGGLERVLSVKATYLAENYDYEVHVLVLNGTHQNPFYEFSPKIQFHSISVTGNPFSYFNSYKTGIQKIVNEIQPDIISVCDDGLKGFFVPQILKTSVPVIYERHASVNISVKKDLKSQTLKKLKHFLMKRKVKDFVKFVVLTKGNVKEWGNYGNIEVIPNPVSFSPEENADLQQKKIIAVGSQGFNKGTDLLLNIWKKIESNFPDWSLEIYGKLNPNHIFQKQAKDLELKNVTFFPAVDNIMEKYLDSSILALTSRSEGFGMVLIEAMSCGVPVVSFDCPHGPRDIISEGEDGFLVTENNEDEFYEKLKILMNDFKLRKEMGKNAKLNVRRYSSEDVVEQWDQLFKELVQ